MIMDAHSKLMELAKASTLFSHVTDLLQPAIDADQLPMCIVWTSRIVFGSDHSGTRKGIYTPETSVEAVIVPGPDTSDEQLNTLRNDLVRYVKRSNGGEYWQPIVSERVYRQIGKQQVKVELLTLMIDDDLVFTK